MREREGGQREGKERERVCETLRGKKIKREGE